MRGFGVHLVQHAPDLIVVLVNDYLDERLADFNKKRLSDRKRWLLVQLPGTTPLVGPVFSPRRGACWTCLAERLAGNRQVKAFLDRAGAHPVVTSPIATAMLGQGAVQLAAVEIAKAIATDFGTDLRDHIVSLDLLASMIARHHVAARRQCAACGQMKRRNPNREPARVELRGGKKLVMTSGGYRSVAPVATVARFRKHVSPLTGVVSHLQRIDHGSPLNASYVAKPNICLRPETECAHGIDRTLFRTFSG